MNKIGGKQLSTVYEHNVITSVSISPASIPPGCSALATPRITRRRWLTKTPLWALTFTSNLNLNFWKFGCAANLGRAGRWRKSEWGRQEQREVTERGTNSTSCWAIEKQNCFTPTRRDAAQSQDAYLGTVKERRRRYRQNSAAVISVKLHLGNFINLVLLNL